jgi:hypothetical protein
MSPASGDIMLSNKEAWWIRGTQPNYKHWKDHFANLLGRLFWVDGRQGSKEDGFKFCILPSPKAAMGIPMPTKKMFSTVLASFKPNYCK